MRRWRITIAGTMGLVALAAVGLATLRHPSPLAASAVFSLAVAVLFAAWVAAICLRGRARAIWASFALCGSGYLYLGSDSREDGTFGPLVTTPLIEIAHERLTGKSDFAYFRVDTAGQAGDNVSKLERWIDPKVSVEAYGHHPLRDQTFQGIVQISHAIFVLVAASAGGLFALALTRISKPKSTTHP